MTGKITDTRIRRTDICACKYANNACHVLRVCLRRRAMFLTGGHRVAAEAEQNVWRKKSCEGCERLFTFKRLPQKCRHGLRAWRAVCSCPIWLMQLNLKRTKKKQVCREPFKPDEIFMCRRLVRRKMGCVSPPGAVCPHPCCLPQ